MKSVPLLLSVIIFVSACTTPEPAERVVRLPPVSPHPALRQKTMPGAVASAVKRAPLPESNEADSPETASDRPHRIPVNPMQTSRIRDGSETWKSLNTQQGAPDYLRSKPRERDPFYDTVNRTGSNPMNTQDRTTNRPSTFR